MTQCKAIAPRLSETPYPNLDNSEATRDILMIEIVVSTPLKMASVAHDICII
jgi:hypothetical protein